MNYFLLHCKYYSLNSGTMDSLKKHLKQVRINMRKTFKLKEKSLSLVTPGVKACPILSSKPVFWHIFNIGNKNCGGVLVAISSLKSEWLQFKTFLRALA